MTDQITFKDKIYNFIEKHGRIISSKALVKTFLKADYDDEVIATKIISSIIGNDQRFEYIEYVGWRVSGSRLESIPISKQKFVIFAANIAKTGSWKGRICEASFTKIINAREDTSLHIGFSPYDSGKQFEIKSGNNSQIQEKKYLGIKIKDAYNILKFIEDSIILFFEPLSTFRQLQMEIKNKTGSQLDNDFLSLKKTMSNLFGLKRNASIDNAANTLSISIFYGDSAQLKAKASAEIFLALIDHLLETGIRYFHELKAIEEKKGKEVCFSRFNFDESFLHSIPETPGIYKFLDHRGNPIYIGKAKNLKRRVSAYFLTYIKRPPKIESIYKTLKRIEYEETGSELEAILRESEMIQSLKPPLNKKIAVHERVASYGKKGNVILVLPGMMEKEIFLYFIKEGKLIKKMKIKSEKKKIPKEKIHDIKYLLKSEYFSIRKQSRKTGKQKGDLKTGKSENNIELILSYLVENRDKVSWFDPTDYRTADEVIRVIISYLKTPLHESERIIQT